MKTFLTKNAAVKALETLFLSEPNNIYNLYKNNKTGRYVLKLENKSNG